MSADRQPPRRLGRGLEALLGTTPRATSEPAEQRSREPYRDPGTTPATPAHPEPGTLTGHDGGLRDIPVAEIRPNQFQPRREFTLAELNELRDSIRGAGLLQPITVRAAPSGRGYELIAGERRLRAVKDLGWRTIPAIVRDFDDRTSLTLALVENLQREDLNPIEEAAGYARLAHEFGLSQGEIAELVGKDRSTVANLMRVLQLPESVRAMLQSGELGVGHARALLALPTEAEVLKLARDTVAQGLSVRAVEERVRSNSARLTHPTPRRPRKDDQRPPEVRHAEELLRKRLQTDVAVAIRNKDRGEVRINFYSSDDLDRLLDLLGARE